MTTARGMYMPGLDGLRAYLVLTVLLFHTSVPGFSGGWIAVDVFFALSGVLITRNLVDELDRSGTVSLADFWVRRTRRLVPALVTFVGVSVLLVTAGAIALRPSAVWGALTYTTNWMHILVPGNGYWDAYAAPDPFEHLWSLAVEEQFYVVWPLVVLVLARWGRRAVTVAAAALCASAVAVQLVGAGSGWSIDRLYQGTDTRALPFLLGALVACRGIPRPGRLVGAGLAAAAVAVLGWAAHTLDGSALSTYRGPLQVVSLAGVVAVAASAHATSPLLCHRVVRTLGQWSYGIYLFHWPLVVMLPEQWGWWWRLPVVAAGSVALAAVSYRVVETPVRRGALQGRRLLPASLAALAVGVVAVGVARPTGQPSDIARAEHAVAWEDLAASAEPPATVPAPGPQSDVSGSAAGGDAGRAPVSVSDRRGGGPAVPALPRRVLVLGDSTANVLAHGLESTGRFQVVDGGVWGCPLVEARRVRPESDVERSADYCPGLQDQIAAIGLISPDVVVAIASATEVWDHAYADDEWTTPGDGVWTAEHDRHMAALVGAHPRVPIVVVPAPDWRPPSDDALETPERRDAWNAQIERWVRAHPQLATMEYVKYLPVPGSAHDREMRPDGAHITDDWIARLAEEHLADDLVTAFRHIAERMATSG